jgi:hypothetical protein
MENGEWRMENGEWRMENKLKYILLKREKPPFRRAEKRPSQKPILFLVR